MCVCARGAIKRIGLGAAAAAGFIVVYARRAEISETTQSYATSSRGLHFDLSPHRRPHVPRAVMDRSHHYCCVRSLALWATQHIYGVSINSLIKTEAMKSLKLHAPKPQLFRCIAACSAAAAAAGDVSNLMSAFASSGNFYSGD
jgi:hypothetical protein